MLMETRIWINVQNEGRWANILMLRGQEVWTLSVIGDIKGLQHKLDPALEALQSGQDPHSLKADWVKSLNIQAITKADISPENDKLTLYHGEKDSKKLFYVTGDKNADTVLQEILAHSGKSFRPVEVEIGVTEALAGPVVVGMIAAVILVLLYANAGMAAAGKQVDIQGAGRGSGFLRMLNDLGQTLGPIGTIAVGGVLLLLIVCWAVWSVKHRAKRTAWLPV